MRVSIFNLYVKQIDQHTIFIIIYFGWWHIQTDFRRHRPWIYEWFFMIPEVPWWDSTLNSCRPVIKYFKKPKNCDSVEIIVAEVSITTWRFFNDLRYRAIIANVTHTAWNIWDAPSVYASFRTNLLGLVWTRFLIKITHFIFCLSFGCGQDMCQGVVQASEKCNICGSHSQLEEKLKEVENLKLKLVNLR